MGYLNIDENALHKLQYCDRTFGLNGSVPTDMLHMFQLGIYIYVSEGLFGEKKASVVAKKGVAKQREKEEQEEEVENSDESDSATVTTQGKNLNASEMSTRNVFNPA
jgi:hypothetical protein